MFFLYRLMQFYIAADRKAELMKEKLNVTGFVSNIFLGPFTTSNQIYNSGLGLT